MVSQVTVTNTTAGFTNNTPPQTNIITVSHTTGSAANRLMLVGISHRENNLVSTVMYGTEELELVGSQTTSNNARTYIYSLLDPPTGTNNVVVTLASGDFDQGGIVGVMTFSGVDQVNPLNTYASLQDNNANPSLAAIPSGANELVFNVIAIQDDNLTAVGSGQVNPGFNQSTPNVVTGAWYINTDADGDMAGGASTKVNGTTMSWTATAGNWSMSAVSIKPVANANLGITKSVLPTTPYAGQTVTFTVTASNAGPANAPLVEVMDLLPSGYTFVDATPSVGSYDTGSGIWSIPTLNNGSPATLTILAKVKPTGAYSNTATIDGNVFDSDLTNNTASISITLCGSGGTAPIFSN